MARELAQRNDDGHVVTLLWDTDARGNNLTWIDVCNGDNAHRVQVDPKLAYHAFTHTGAYVPEAWAKEVSNGIV